MKLTYSRIGDYLLPDLILSEPPPELTRPLGKFACMRRMYLREHRPILYNTLLLSEQLFPHLREVQTEAHDRIKAIMSDILVPDPPPYKAVDGLAWAAYMEKIRCIAEKMMLDKVVYT